MKIKAVIFDWNGVVTDSFSLDHSIFVDDIRQLKLKVPKSKKFYKDLYHGNIFESLLKIGFSKENLANDDTYRERYLNGIKNTKLFPGLKPLLARLHKKYKMAVITSNYKATVDVFNKKHGIEKFFDRVLTADTHRYKEEKIKALLKEFSLRKHEVIFIGDTVNDILACRKTGIRIIAATWGYHEKARLKKAKPDFIAETPQEIMKILEKLEKF